MTPANEISKAARQSFNVGFGRSTTAIVLGLIVAGGIVLGFTIIGFLLRPPVIYVDKDRWRCQIATEARVALCRLPPPPQATEAPKTSENP